jgi:hypothetical protein
MYTPHPSPAALEMILAGQEYNKDALARVVGAGARVELFDTLVDTVDGLTIDRFRIHLVHPLDAQRKSVLSAMSYNLTYADKSRTAIVDIDQRSYDRRLFRNDWTMNQRLAAGITTLLVVFLFGVVYMVDHYRTDHLHGASILSEIAGAL